MALHETMNRTFAILVSVVFHPVFINLLGFVAVIELNPHLQAGLTPQAKWFYMVYVFISTGLIPLFVVLARKAFGFSNSIMLNDADDRHIPYIVTATAYLFGYYLFVNMGTPHVMQGYMLGSACILVAVLIINFRTKISAHTTSLGALVGLILALSPIMVFDVRILLIPLLLISGLTATARLALEAHTHQQLYSGFGLGFLLMWMML